MILCLSVLVDLKWTGMLRLHVYNNLILWDLGCSAVIIPEEDPAFLKAHFDMHRLTDACLSYFCQTWRCSLLLVISILTSSG